jgi:uncharacterized pyridoxamine 5'-phosphate oxidase family protein
MGAVAARLLEQHHLAYLATVRRDGSPRVHPVSPFVIDGRLYVATPRTSPKARDQEREPRCVIHMLPGENDDECMLRVRARAVTGTAERALVKERGPHYVHEDDHYFEYDLKQAMTAYWVDVGKPGTYAVRRWWRP